MTTEGGEKKSNFLGRLVAKDKSAAAGYLRCFNLLNAILIAFAGIYSLISPGNIITLDISTIILSAYISCFGCMFCCFELRFSYFEKRTREWFGFMYTYIGRTIFLFFVGSFCVGLVGNSDMSALGWAVGAITMANGFINCIVIARHPDFKMFEDPTGKYTSGGDVAKNYVKENPELAQKAAQGALTAAKDNPEMAKDFVTAGAGYAAQNPDVALNVASSAATDDNPFQTSIY